MTIPDFQKIRQHLLKYASDGKEHSLREAIEGLADEFNLSQSERKELLPSDPADQNAFKKVWSISRRSQKRIF